MATLFKLLMSLIFFLAIFYSTTIMMSYLYALDAGIATHVTQMR
jgi:hypothetical protein